jgi:putative membrane protein
MSDPTDDGVPRQGPVLIDLEPDTELASPAEAPPVPDVLGASGGLDQGQAQGQAMQMAAQLAARKPSRLTRWFWGLLLSLLGVVVSAAAWRFVAGLIADVPILGYGVAGLVALFLIVVAGIVLREIAGFARLARMDRMIRLAEDAAAADDLGMARDYADRLTRLYADREDMQWYRARFADRRDEQFDAKALLSLAEKEMLSPLDTLALREVEAASRQVATVTALVPLALADVAVALGANVRMIRRVAEVYGGRSGVLGSWRLTRAVMTHLVATGAVSIGDDVIGSVVGGNVLTRLSRRFGEGIVNGALTARVGVAAMEVCRPMPFGAGLRPRVTSVLRRALTGLFGDGDGKDDGKSNRAAS